MYLIAGLGNPGEAYKHTRHNIGFQVVDHLAASFSASWKKGKGNYMLAQVQDGAEKLLLIKPETYMNLSGQAVQSALDWFQVPLENLLVVTDDIHLETGGLRLRKEGSAGGHNGLADISRQLGSNGWARLRFGVGNAFRPGQQADYVLGRFPAGEQPVVQAAVERATDCVLAFVRQGIDRAMNQYNTKPSQERTSPQ
jgi:PTH1 family peptidyl-tRNA hydrolase